jgi:hypothetical protein
MYSPAASAEGERPNVGSSGQQMEGEQDLPKDAISEHDLAAEKGAFGFLTKLALFSVAVAIVFIWHKTRSNSRGRFTSDTRIHKSMV